MKKKKINENSISVYAIIQNKGKVLLTQDYYKPGWKLPGGGVENNELIMDALNREVKEEVNLNIQPKQLLLISNWIRKKTLQGRIRIYFVADLAGGSLSLKDKEVKIARWFSREELFNLKRKEFLFPQHYYAALQLYLKGKGGKFKLKKTVEPARYDLLIGN